MSKGSAILISEIFPPRHGGSGRWFWELYNRLPKNQSLIAAGDSEGALDFDNTHSLNLKRLPLASSSWGFASLTGLRFYISSFFRLRKLIKNNKITAIHCGRCLPEGLIGLLLSKWFRLPLLSYIHGEDIETAALSRQHSILVKIALKHNDRLICNSQNTANLLIEKWQADPAKITVLHPGVDSSKFVPTPFDEAQRTKLGWNNKKVILTVGRLQKRKGHDMMIKAMPEILKQEPNAFYCIIGSGEEKDYLLKLANDLNVKNSIQLLDEINDALLLNCYQQCDIFILPNRTVGADIEGFGMVLVEAQSCGKAVIAGDSGGTRETMKVNETGLIIDCTNEALIANQVIDILKDKQQLTTMGQRAREHVVDTLDWQAHAQKAKTIFDSL